MLFWPRIPLFSPCPTYVASGGIDTLEKAIKAFIATKPAISNGFTGGIYAGRRPPGKTAPYLIIEIVANPAVLFTNTSFVQATHLVFTSYGSSRSAAKTLGNLVQSTFKGQGFQYTGATIAPLTIQNRTAYEAPEMAVGGGPVFCDRITFVGREQKPR